MSPTELWAKCEDRILKAKSASAEKRNSAFLDSPEGILGYDVTHLTVNKLLVLEQVDSLFLRLKPDSPVELDDLSLALWVLSTEFSLSRKKAIRFRRKAKRKIARKLVTAITEIATAITFPFEFSSGADKGGLGGLSWVASLVDTLASQYGWAEETILNLPVARALQYIQSAKSRQNGDAPLFNPEVDRIKAEYLAEVAKINAQGETSKHG